MLLIEAISRSIVISRIRLQVRMSDRNQARAHGETWFCGRRHHAQSAARVACADAGSVPQLCNSRRKLPKLAESWRSAGQRLYAHVVSACLEMIPDPLFY